jgi:hypothetical protein
MWTEADFKTACAKMMDMKKGSSDPAMGK